MPGKDYGLIVTRSARKELLGLPPKVSEQVERAIDRLLSHFNAGERPQDMRPLRGNPGMYRLDSGEYRIVLLLDEPAATITIVRVRHRKDVYRNL